MAIMQKENHEFVVTLAQFAPRQINGQPGQHIRQRYGAVSVTADGILYCWAYDPDRFRVVGRGAFGPEVPEAIFAKGAWLGVECTLNRAEEIDRLVKDL
jgi:hypothetical protein